MLHFSGLLQTRAIQQECSMTTTQEITFLIPPYGTATLTLPERLSPDAYARLDSLIGVALREPCRNGSADTANTDTANDPGAIEFASWLVHLH
jgi:hypothetical protein